MDENFTDINRRAIKAVLVLRLQDLLQAVENANFETEFYEDPGSPLVDKLIAFKAFFDEVPVAGWQFMKHEADTPEEIAQAYSNLASKGVSFGG